MRGRFWCFVPPVTPPASDASRFRLTAVRVFAVQVVTLLLLWWLQATFTP